jgi:hypothetical protein
VVGKVNLPPDAEGRPEAKGSATDTPGLNAVDQEREASMADEGGAAGATVERENRPTDKETVEAARGRPKSGGRRNRNR